MRIRSRLIYPVSRPPIENGGLFISNGRFAEVGDWNHIRKVGSGEVIDLGEVIILPGLINAHCHLDYTAMAGKISPPKSFPDWIKAILALKAGWSFSEYAASWLIGAKMLLQTGTTTVADIEAVPELLPDSWAATPLRILSFLEMTGVNEDRLPSGILNEALQKIESLPGQETNSGLSPHALYSTKPGLLKLSAQSAAQKNLRIAMHVAESREEFEMYSARSGELFNWLQKQRDMSDCGDTTPIREIGKCGLLNSNFMAVHVNYLGEGDADLLAKNKCSVVHCPSSHAYFGHGSFPFQLLRQAGVNICLGTDSLASFNPEFGKNSELNMFLEMQRFARKFPHISPKEIIEMATINAAKALHLQGSAGEIAKNAFADFIVLQCLANAEDSPESVLAQKGARQSWISGRCVYASD